MMGRYLVTIDNIRTVADGLNMAIADDAEVYSKSWEWGTGEYYALDYIATSGGTTGLKIELEQGNEHPGTEGSSDTNWVVAENAQDIESNLDDEDQHLKKLSPVVSRYGRLKIKGSSGNASDTTLRAKLARQEEV